MSMSSIAVSENMTKADFLDEAGRGITDALCTFDRFLTCTGDSEKLCRAQTTMVIVPHCLKKYEASLPDVLSDQQAQAAADRIKNALLLRIRH